MCSLLKADPDSGTLKESVPNNGSETTDAFSNSAEMVQSEFQTPVEREPLDKKKRLS